MRTRRRHGGAGRTDGSFGPGPNASLIVGLIGKTPQTQQLPVKISTLGPNEQVIAYRRLHQTATPVQIAEYYKLHCRQLDEMHYRVIDDRLAHFGDRNQMLHKGLYLFEAPHRLAKKFETLAQDSAMEREMESLVEECETLLPQKKGQGKSTAIDWRPLKRWRDGEREGPGLSEEEVRAGTIFEVRGQNVSSRRVSVVAPKAVLRKWFARSFPQAANKRIGAVDGEMSTEHPSNSGANLTKRY